MCIENKLNVVTSIFYVSVVCLLNVLFWSPNENKLTHCGLFVRASVKEIKQEIFEILTARCLNCFLSVISIALVGAWLSNNTSDHKPFKVFPQRITYL